MYLVMYTSETKGDTHDDSEIVFFDACAIFIFFLSGVITLVINDIQFPPFIINQYCTSHTVGSSNVVYGSDTRIQNGDDP